MTDAEDVEATGEATPALGTKTVGAEAWLKPPSIANLAADDVPCLGSCMIALMPKLLSRPACRTRRRTESPVSGNQQEWQRFED
mmetsp:Transcript_23482/g.36791  ORF Transcript_23482/g.36791 Transcript_23482/m.36791 type:complete len:84 (-) Transcript_23482:6-257(-)